jgi:hypothetical protein
MAPTFLLNSRLPWLDVCASADFDRLESPVGKCAPFAPCPRGNGGHASLCPSYAAETAGLAAGATAGPSPT